MSSRNFILLTAAIVIGCGVTIFAFSKGWLSNDQLIVNRHNEAGESDSIENGAEVSDKQSESVTAKPLHESLGIEQSEILELGGIQRPKRDLRTKTVGGSSPVSPVRSAGRLPRLNGTENPQVAKLHKELKSKDAPKEALSAAFVPEKFDPVAYKKDPEKYLSQIRPGRAFQTAEPGPGVTAIAPVSQRFVPILQGESAILRVKANPDSPVHFYAIDGGEFDNRLKSISVAASADGVAEAKYTAVTGTRGIMDVTATSPEHSGRVNFAVKVMLPE